MFLNVSRQLVGLGNHLSITFDHINGSLQFVRREITAEHVIVVLRVNIYILFVRREKLATLCRFICFMFRSDFSHIKVCWEMSDVTIIPVLYQVLLTRGLWTYVIDEVSLC